MALRSTSLGNGLKKKILLGEKKSQGIDKIMVCEVLSYQNSSNNGGQGLLNCKIKGQTYAMSLPACRIPQWG